MNHKGKFLLRANAVAKRVILLNWKYAEGLKLAELYTGLSELTHVEKIISIITRFLFFGNLSGKYSHNFQRLMTELSHYT